MINFNKTLSSVIKDRNQPGLESANYCNVTLVDPSVEYKMVEKIEMEDQKRNENKIQNKEQKMDMPEEKVSQKPGSDKDGAAGAAKKKKPIFEDVRQNSAQYTEIYRILLKNKQEKLKENDNKDKNAEDQKKCVEIFAKEAGFASQRNTNEPNFARREIYYEVVLSSYRKKTLHQTR